MAEIEKAKKEKERYLDELKSQEKKRREQEQAIRDQQLKEERELDKEDNERNALIQDVINESKEAGIEFPPSVRRLLNHVKGKFYIFKHLPPFFYCIYFFLLIKVQCQATVGIYVMPITRCAMSTETFKNNWK